jgi:hypothetical protein
MCSGNITCMKTSWTISILITPDDLTKCIIDGLPPEFGPGQTSLYAPCAGDDPSVILRYSDAYMPTGSSSTDMKPRPAPKAAKTTLPDNSSTESTQEQQRERDGHAAGSAVNLDTSPRSAQSGRTLQATECQ